MVSWLQKQKDKQRRLEKHTKATLAKVQKEYKIDLNRGKEEYDPGEFSRKILRAKDISLIGGPFHYNVRSATYGDPWDEIPWKVRMGMAYTRERGGWVENPLACSYGEETLINNWVEEQRDRQYIKYHGPRISQYGHYYVTETMRAFAKPVCNKARDVLLDIKSFPLTGHPAHQPELNVDTLRHSAPTPVICCEDQKIAECAKEAERAKRYYKASL